MSSGTWLAERQILDAGFRVEMSYPNGSHKLEIGNSTRAMLARASAKGVTISVVVGTESAEVIRMSHDEVLELIAFLQKRVYGKTVEDDVDDGVVERAPERARALG